MAMGCGGSKEAAIDLATVARNPAAFVLILSGHHDHPACNGKYTYGGVANGKPQWVKEGGGGEKVFWTGSTWDCFWGGYSPEAPVATPVPPLAGYDRDRGGCDIKVRYERATDAGGGSGSSASGGLREAIDGAPRLKLVAAGSDDALRFDNAATLRAGGEAPLTANGKNVGLYWSQPRNAWGHWDYIDLGVSEKLRPLSVKLDGPYLIWNGPHGEFAFDVSMWQLHEGRHLVAVKACAGNPGGPTRMSKDAAGRDFVLHADGTIGPRTAPHLRLGVFVPKPPAPAKPCGPGWSAHQNIDMCEQGDVIHNWREKHSLDELMRKVEQNGYSAVCVGNFEPAFLKKFPYQLTAGHCKPSSGYTNTLYIWSGGGSGKAVPAVEETGTVVEAGGAPPPLHDIVDALKRNLGLDGTWPEVVDAACLQLGVAPTGSLQEKGDACWRAMEG